MAEAASFTSVRLLVCSSATGSRQMFGETDAIVKTGTPWFAKYGLTMEQLHATRASEGWHARYGGGTAAAGTPGKTDPNAVY